MTSSEYSFIDIAVLDEVRERFAAGDALIILSADLGEVIWANGPGAALIGFADIEAVMGAPPPFSPAACRQISATPGFPEIGRDRPLIVRIARGLASRPIPFFASALSLPDGERALMLANPLGEGDAGRSARDVAARAIGGISNAGYFAALIGSDGMLAATPGFDQLGITEDAIGAILVEAKNAPGRLVKRHLPASGRNIPAGTARLRDDPLTCLLIAVDTADVALVAPGDAAHPNLDRADAAADDESIARPGAIDTAEDASPTIEAEAQDAPDRASPMPTPDTDPTQETTRRAVEAPTSADLPTGPVRFVWRTDTESRFSKISEEFAAAVGGLALDLAGRPFREVADLLDLDSGEEIATLLERRDTWSGRTVLWPVSGTGKRVPVDLAALPAYSRDRVFEGFRGFGIARFGDLVDEPRTRHDAPIADDEAEPLQAEGSTDGLPADEPGDDAAPETDAAEKIVHLSEHRPPERAGGLSDTERNAFREIGQRLKAAYERRDADTSEDTAPDGTVPHETDGTGGPTPSLAGTEASARPTTHVEPVAEGDDEEIGALPAREKEMEASPSSAEPTAEPRRPAPAIIPSAFAGEMARQAVVDRAFVSGLPLPLLVHRGDDLYFANEAFFRLTGFETLAELEAAGGLDSLFVEPYRADEEPDTPADGLVLRDRAGSTFPVQAHLQSIPWEGRKALLLALVAQNTKPEASAPPPLATLPSDETLRVEVEEMRTILDTATDGVVLIAPDGTVRSINGPASALFGLDSSDISGKPFTSLFALESQRAARDYLHGLAENGVASVLNDGREVIGREAHGRFIPLFMTIGRLPAGRGFCAVMRDITQWKRAEEELTQARTLAERASSQKTDFLARVSHEIRTPLNAIIGFSELMIDEKFGPIGNGRYRDYLRDINRSGNHVLDLVNDLLDISKIEAGEQEMSYEAVSLNDALAQTVAMMQPQANRERVIIRSSFASRLPDVVADLRSVRQIALNLLSNAIRFTPPGGQVIVSTAYETSGEIVMRVRDTGIGMSSAEIDQALKPFKQVSTLKRTRMDGTGLGLPLTKAMVEANRARFAIHSTPGDGTLVEITFPSTRVLAE